MTLTEACRAFRGEQSSVAAARHFAADAVRHLGPETSETAGVVVSEVATNAVLHARSEFVLSLAVEDDEVLISVSDNGAGQPELHLAPSPSAEHGRGLAIVDALADRWGVDPEPRRTGKTVWAALKVRSGSARTVD